MTGVSLTNKMKSVCVLLCLVAVAYAASKKFTTQWDGVDVAQVIKNERLYKNYFNCVMERGKCTPDGQALKEAIPQALANNCEQCSEVQKKKSKEAVELILKHHQKDFKEMERKFDPTGAYRRNNGDLIKELGLAIDF